MTDLDYSPLTMLIDLTKYSQPEGLYQNDHFAIRNFDQIDIDKSKWIEILLAADEIDSRESGEIRFKQLLEKGIKEIQNRILFFYDLATGITVGTISAWNGEHDGVYMGRIHWLAVLEEFQGIGLGKALLHFALDKLKDEFTQAYLHTSAKNEKAIALYLDAGFKIV